VSKIADVSDGKNSKMEETVMVDVARFTSTATKICAMRISPVSRSMTTGAPSPA
jgi:hypothetical protein